MQSMVWMVLTASPPTPLSLFVTPITFRFAVQGKKDERNTMSGVVVGEHFLPRPLECVDEVLDLVGVEPLRAFRFEAYDLEERVLEDLKAALQREDDLEPAEDAVGDADEVPVNGGKRENLVRGGNVRLVDLDLQDRRRIGALLCKTAGDPDLRGDSSPVPADILPGE